MRNHRRCSKLHGRFRLQESRESMTVEMVTTKEDGDEDGFESTEVLAWKATESRNELQKQKVSEQDTFPESPAEGAKKSQTTRSTESEAQRATNEQPRVAEVTKIETSKINHEVVNDTWSKKLESQKFYRGQVVTTCEQAADSFFPRPYCEDRNITRQKPEDTLESCGMWRKRRSNSKESKPQISV